MQKIRILPENVSSQLRSGIAITSIGQCVAELVLNAIDADASCIAIRLDISTFKIQVIDNGTGISKSQLHIVGERYATSKCSESTLKQFGCRGEALASIRNMSSIVMIETKAHDDDGTWCKCFTQNVSQGVKRSTTNRASHGTTITVLDFMYNLPVRRMNIDAIFDFEWIRAYVGAIAISHPHISFTLRDDSDGKIALKTTKCLNSLSTFKMLFGNSKGELLKEVCWQDDKVLISGHVATEGHTNRKLQFIYVNGHFLSHSKIHKLIDAMCCQTSIGRKFGRFRSPNETLDGAEMQVKYLNSRSYDKWCMMILNYECERTEYDIGLEPKKSIIEFKDWSVVLTATERLMCKFFSENDLIMKAEVADLPSKVCLTKSTSDDNDLSTKNFVWSRVAKRTYDKTQDLQTEVLKFEVGLTSPFFNKSQDVNEEEIFTKLRKKHDESPFPVKFTHKPKKSMIKDLASKVEKAMALNGLKKFAFLSKKSPEKYIAKNKSHMKCSEYTENTIEGNKIQVLNLMKESRAPSGLADDAKVSESSLECTKVSSSSVQLFNSIDMSVDPGKLAFDRLKCLEATNSISKELPVFSAKHGDDMGPDGDLECTLIPCSSKNTPLKPVILEKSALDFHENDTFREHPEFINQLNKTNELGSAREVSNRNCQNAEKLNFEGKNRRFEIEADSVTLENCNSCWMNGKDAFDNDIYINKINGQSFFTMPGQENINENEPLGANNSLKRLTKYWPHSSGNILESEHKDHENEMQSFFKNWDNPVFDFEKSIFNIDDKKAETVQKIKSATQPCSFPKEMLKSIKVLGQIDNKFIVCIGASNWSTYPSCHDWLMLFDQHAVDERIRIENLTKDAFITVDGVAMLKSSILDPPLVMEIEKGSIGLLKKYCTQFLINGTDIQVSELTNQVKVLSVPECIMKKEMNELDNNRASVIGNIISTMIKNECDALLDTRGSKKGLPKVVWDILCTQACRGAIKFGQNLTISECKQLLTNLSKCDSPFQCAHGRPSFVPLLNLHQLKNIKTFQKDFPRLLTLGRGRNRR